MAGADGWDWGKKTSSIWEEPDPELVSLASAWRHEDRLHALDLGCGPGRHALLLAKQGFRVTAYDISASGLERLAARASQESLAIGSVRGDMRALPFADAEFDVIVAFNSVYHASAAGVKRAVGEIARCLCSGGQLYATFIASCSVPSPGRGPDSPVEGDPRVRWKQEEEGSLLPHYYVDEPELRGLLADFHVLDLRLEDRPSYAGGSRHYRVLAERS
jgi:SAM-dependent methyltransferase